MHNPDPRLWRWWVLAVVVLGMVLVAWVWISGLGPPAVDDAQAISTTSATALSTTASDDTGSAAADTEEEETTTTTLSVPYIDVYLDNLGDAGKALAEVVAEVDAIEDEWGNRDITYRVAEERVMEVTERALAFSNSVALHRPPDSVPGLADAHRRMSDAADSVATAVEALLSVMTRSEIEPPMGNPLVVLRSAAESFCEQVDQITEIALHR